jgi:hypothetical protein
MLPESRVQAIEQDATLSASALDDESLKWETLRLTLEHRDAPIGDKKAELLIRESVYTLEMGRRRLSAK